MIGWFKMQATAATNAKLAKAGLEGRVVYWALLCQRQLHGDAGLVPATHAAPDVLRIEAVALVGDLDEQAVAEALRRCEQAGLIERRDDGVLIVGYDESVMPGCTKCHRPNPSRYKTCDACRAAASGKGANRSHKGAKDSRRRERQIERVPPQPPTGAGAGAPHGDGGRAERAGERAARAPETEQHDPVIELQAALADTSYRDRAGPRRRWVLLERAKQLAETGLTADRVPELVELAAGGKDPGALLAHWLDGGTWREVVDEAAQLGRQAAALVRGAAARAAEGA